MSIQSDFKIREDCMGYKGTVARTDLQRVILPARDKFFDFNRPISDACSQ